MFVLGGEGQLGPRAATNLAGAVSLRAMCWRKLYCLPFVVFKTLKMHHLTSLLDQPYSAKVFSAHTLGTRSLMSSGLAHYNSEEIEHLSNGFQKMGREYKSAHGSNRNRFLYKSTHFETTQDGWDEDADELEEEDVWGVQGTDTGWDHSYHEENGASSAYQSLTANGGSTKGVKGRKSWLTMELQAAGQKKEHVGVGFAALDAVHNGIYGSGKESHGGWAPGFLTRKVKVPHLAGGTGGSGYGNGWYEDKGGTKRGGVLQSAPVSMAMWPSKYEFGESNGGADAGDGACEDDADHEDYDDNDDEDYEGDGERGRGGRLAPHEIVDREYARSQSTTFSVIEGAGRTLKGMDLRRVRNAVWSRTGFED